MVLEIINLMMVRYIGEFKNDNYLVGTLFLNNGDVYEGEFKNGLFDGIGKYTYTSGLIEEGTAKMVYFCHQILIQII